MYVFYRILPGPHPETKFSRCEDVELPYESFAYDIDYTTRPNRKGGINLHCAGYAYRRKMAYQNTINWVCAYPLSKPPHTLRYPGRCAARCITNASGGIKFSKKPHNHAPTTVRTHFDPAEDEEKLANDDFACF
ncbi:Mod(mdg4)-h55.7b [Anopheles sinensis]|uniref:FLYWCH-type domain-containing protein n=1 Tax=Anopheles sinensis TaxID=74873 RepID=A0A084WSS4_ANOSI|nr:Mod(mdg4)-h55.7b [Anopheles sinensis]